MDAIFHSLIILATQWMRPRYNARMQLLEAQIRMLRSRIGTSRIVPTPQERAELRRLGARIDHDIDEVIHVIRIKVASSAARSQGVSASGPASNSVDDQTPGIAHGQSQLAVGVSACRRRD